MTILAIDDNEDNLVVLRALLTDSFPDSSLHAARSGEEGIEAARAVNPDVILLDLVMPVMDGFEVCAILKADEELRRIPVIIVTAVKTEPESRVRALKLGAEAFLSKPVDAAELAALVASMARIRETEKLLRYENERLAQRGAELRRAYAEMESFAYSVSHDLRAPLRAIDAFSGFLLEDCGQALGGEGRRLLDVIRSKAGRMEALIDGLLNLSRVSSGVLSLACIDMTALADSMYHEAAAERGGEGFELLLHPLPPARGDSTLIRQVWYNLISNAINPLFSRTPSNDSKPNPGRFGV